MNGGLALTLPKERVMILPLSWDLPRPTSSWLASRLQAAPVPPPSWLLSSLPSPDGPLPELQTRADHPDLPNITKRLQVFTPTLSLFQPSPPQTTVVPRVVNREPMSLPPLSCQQVLLVPNEKYNWNANSPPLLTFRPTASHWRTPTAP